MDAACASASMSVSASFASLSSLGCSVDLSSFNGVSTCSGLVTAYQGLCSSIVTCVGGGRRLKEFTIEDRVLGGVRLAMEGLLAKRGVKEKTNTDKTFGARRLSESGQIHLEVTIDMSADPTTGQEFLTEADAMQAAAGVQTTLNNFVANPATMSTALNVGNAGTQFTVQSTTPPDVSSGVDAQSPSPQGAVSSGLIGAVVGALFAGMLLVGLIVCCANRGGTEDAKALITEYPMGAVGMGGRTPTVQAAPNKYGNHMVEIGGGSMAGQV
jgi:hypothetical protein